jgi:hypothetical protein
MYVKTRWNSILELLERAYPLQEFTCQWLKNPKHSEYISKMNFSFWKTPGVSERMWSVNLEASISGEYQTLAGYVGRPLEELGFLMTGTGVTRTSDD